MATDSQFPLQLSDFVDAETLQELQAGYCSIGRLAGLMVDSGGRDLTQPTWAGESADPGNRSVLIEPMRSAARKAVRQGNPICKELEQGLRCLAAPVVVDGESIAGVVLAGRNLAGPPTEHDPAATERLNAAGDFLQTFCETLARLCHQARELRNRVEELRTVYNVTGLLAGKRDLQEILDLTGRQVVDVIRCKACSIRLLDEATGLLTIKAVCNLSEAYLSKGPVSVSENPIDEEALEGKIVYIADAPSDPRTRYPEQARAEGLVSGLIAGMIYRGKPVGVVRVYTGVKYRFSPFEAALLRAIASQTAAAIVNARLHEEAIEADRYARQMHYAGQVQRRMIPKHPPAHASMQFGCIYDPTLEVGGDFYDFIELSEGHLGIAIADVVGKGVPASVMMASVRSALRAYAHNVYDINEILSHVNRHMCRDTLTSEFATLFYGVLSPDGRTLTYCNAGHDPPLLLRDGKIIRLDVGGLAIGVIPDEAYVRDVVKLEPGDLILLYTDGVVEALNFADQAFGRQRLEESLIRYRDLHGGKIAHNVLWDVRRFVGLADQTDDITMVSIKVP